MFTRLEALYSTIDETTRHIAATHGSEIKCSKGCADCCHASFDVSLIEGHYILKAFRDLPRNIRRPALKNAEKAMRQWKKMIDDKLDVSRVRIRCPLLGQDNTCIIYDARPVNCRTYGVPTEIHGHGHVCRLSGFEPGKSYPTVKLDQIQNMLLSLSAEINRDMSSRRWPIAAVLLSDQG